MEKRNEFMEKVKTDEALQKKLAQIIGEGGAKLQPIPPHVEKYPGVAWRSCPPLPPSPPIEWENDYLKYPEPMKPKAILPTEDCPEGDVVDT